MTIDDSVDRDEDGQLADVAGFSGTRLARITNFFNVEVARGLTPGAVLLIERAGETVMRRAFGYRDRAVGAPMTLDTIFRIYSMTKPMVSVVTMMLVAEGRLHLSQPVADFIPAFAEIRVLEDGIETAAHTPPTVHDLLRHTAGLPYARTDLLEARYADAKLFSDPLTNETFAERIARLPLAHQPGRVWAYGHATELLGRIVEVVSGRSLGAVLRQRLTDPLGMVDTAFHVARPQDHTRIAEPFPGDTLEDGGPPMFDPRVPNAFEAGGKGLVSTLDDYARFARMLLAGGTLGTEVTLSRASLRFMTADHIAPETGIVKGPNFLPGPGFGFGLGFAVRTATGVSAYPGSTGEFGWSGIGGTYFWIDPAEDLFVILLEQAPRQRVRHRPIIKALVYDALVGKRALRAEARRRKSQM